MVRRTHSFLPTHELVLYYNLIWILILHYKITTRSVSFRWVAYCLNGQKKIKKNCKKILISENKTIRYKSLHLRINPSSMVCWLFNLLIYVVYLFVCVSENHKEIVLSVPNGNGVRLELKKFFASVQLFNIIIWFCAIFDFRKCELFLSTTNSHYCHKVYNHNM